MDATRNRRILWGAGLLGICSVAFLVGRELTTRRAATAETPPTIPAVAVEPDVTPVAGATPDRTQPNWFVPYLNRDRDLPKLMGEVNDIVVGSEGLNAQPIRTCAGKLEAAVGDDARRRVASSSLDIPQAATAGLKPTVPLVATICDGKVVETVAFFQVPAGTSGVNIGGGVVEIRRQLGARGYALDETAVRWKSGDVHGRRAALLAPVIDTIGTTAVIVTSKTPDGEESTLFRGAGVTLDFLAQLAGEVYP